MTKILTIIVGVQLNALPIIVLFILFTLLAAASPF